MTSGPGRPGQPMPGQRSIFGTGRGPVFAQMPAYKPVTRASEPQPHAPEPPRPDYGAYARQGVEPQAPQMPGVSGYANQNGAAPSYHTQGAPARSYDTPDFPIPSHPSRPISRSRRAISRSKATSRSRNRATSPSRSRATSRNTRGRATSHSRRNTQARATSRSRTPSRAVRLQARRAQFRPSRHTSLSQAPRTPSRMPASQTEIFPAEATQHAGHAEQEYDDTNYAPTRATATHPSRMRASLTPPSRMQVSPRRRPIRITPKRPRIMTSLARMTLCISTKLPLPTAPNPIRSCSPINQGTIIRPGTIIWRRPRTGASPRPLPSHQALQAFDAGYEQPPQIALGRTQYPNQMPPQNAPQDFYESDQGDADFLDESQFMTPGEAEAKPARKFSLRSRSMYMVGSALLGAIALGGALAFAYKQSGGAMGGGQTPVVQADSRPVKEAPQQAGGKEFPHKNKLIYERLQNGDQPEAERIVPRQEELAMPAMPGGAVPAPAGVAPAAPPAVATVDDPDGGPRRVKTMVVRPDGTMAEAAAPAPAPQQAAAAAPPPAAPQQVAFAEPPMPAPPMPQAAPMPVPAAAPVAPGRSAASRRRSAARRGNSAAAASCRRRARAGTGETDQIRGAGGFEAESDRGARHLRRHAAEISVAARKLPADGAEGRPWHEGRVVSPAHRTDRRQDGRDQALRPAQVARSPRLPGDGSAIVGGSA